MRAQQLHIVLIIFTFVLSLFLVIAAAKYAEWARVMVTGGTGSWLSLVFYIGTVPTISLFLSTLHLVGLHLEIISLDPEYEDSAMATTVLIASLAQYVMWLGQASISVTCELGPILSGAQGNVASWCPQSRFRDAGSPGLADMLAQIAMVKDISAWVMVLLTAGLVECARRRWREAKMLKELELPTGGRNQKERGYSQSRSEGYEMRELRLQSSDAFTKGRLTRNVTQNYESRV